MSHRTTQSRFSRRAFGQNVWLQSGDSTALPPALTKPYGYEVLPDESAVGRAMFEELQAAADAKTGDVVIILLGGRGAQALHKLLGEKAKTDEIDALLGRLRVFTQDALAPMAGSNAFSFVRDFERLLGTAFFLKVKSFTSMLTDTNDLESGLLGYIEKLEQLGEVDIFFVGLGPEAENASHLCYIKPHSGAQAGDVAGIIPISESILEHHIAKFKAGGSQTGNCDEVECRRATHILTLGPGVILRARRIVQSIVDGATSPSKPACFRRMLKEELSPDAKQRAAQLDANPSLWLRLHPNVRSLILPDILSSDLL